MQSNPEYHARIHPALTSFTDECIATLARLIAYVGVLALLGIVGLHFWEQFSAGTDTEPAGKAGFSAASRSRPQFAVSSLDPPEKSETYDIFRHPEGGRKDIFHWGPAGEKPVAELEIYRPGGEFNPAEPTGPEIALRIDPESRRELEAAGVIDSKFGAVTLLRFTAAPDGAKSCLGFFKRIDDPALQISGWSCQGSGLPARRLAIGCMLNRL